MMALIELGSWIAGAALLFAGGGALTRGALGLAAGARMPARAAAATIVAFGASAPELASAFGLVRFGLEPAVPAMTATAVLANVLLVIGLAALIARVPANGPGARRGAIAAAATGIVLAIWALSGATAGILAGAIALAVCAAHAWGLEQAAAAGEPDPETEGHEDVYTRQRAPKGIAGALGLVALGLAGLGAGTWLAVPAAASLGGATAANTGLWLGMAAIAPELGAALAAALTGRSGMIVPAAFAGVVFNGLAVNGAAALAAPLGVADGRIEAMVLLAGAAATALALRSLVKAPVGKVEGLVGLLAFLVALVLSG
jgi:cation:H+ antiporter